MTNVQELERAFIATIIGLDEHDAGVLIEAYGAGDACSVPLFRVEQQHATIVDGLPKGHPYA